jgi:phenylacetate-CoA ligase
MYQKIYEKAYFPLFEKVIKRRKIAEIYVKSLQTQWRDLDDNKYDQVIRFREILMHADMYCPYYSLLFQKVGFNPKSLKRIEDAEVLPLLTKDIIRANLSELTSRKNAGQLWPKSTGGSTGQPLRFYYTKESYEWRVAMSKRGYLWAGARLGSRQAYIWGVAIGERTSFSDWKERLQHAIDRHRYFNCFEFDEKKMAECLIELRKFRPEVIVGYTNPLYNFAKFINKNGKLGFLPVGIICAAEKVHSYQREEMENIFGCPVYNTYGSREFMLIASECERKEGLHINIENLVVEIIKEDGSPAKAGETGKVVITDLHNFGMPFIRYEIGDLAVHTEQICSCGRGLPLLGEVTGRSLDVIRTPDGKVVPGEFFPHLMKEFPDVYKFQIVQNLSDELQIKLVPVSMEITSVTLEMIEKEIRKVIGYATRIKYQIVSDIPLTKTGKLRVTVSNIKGVHS